MALKEKKPGDHLILRLKNNESPLILDWINQQSNLSDAIRFLIEEEIKTHAIRDLQEYIPAKRRPLEAAVEQAASEEKVYIPEVVKEAHPEPEVQSRSATQVQEELPDQAKEEQETEQVQEPESKPEEVITVPKPTEPEVEEEKAPHPESESEAELEPEAEKDEEEYSDEIIDHWMNI